MNREEKSFKKAADSLGQFGVSLNEIDLAVAKVSAAAANLRHRLGSEAAIYKATLRRNQELEVELDRLRGAQPAPEAPREARNDA